MTPDDVYELVTRLSQRTLALQILTIGILVVLALFACPASIAFLLQMKRSNRILDMAERHGEITDAQAERIKRITQDEVRHLLDVKDKVSQVDDRVVQVDQKVEVVKEVVTQTLTPAPRPQPVDPNNPPRRRSSDHE